MIQNRPNNTKNNKKIEISAPYREYHFQAATIASGPTAGVERCRHHLASTAYPSSPLSPTRGLSGCHFAIMLQLNATESLPPGRMTFKDSMIDIIYETLCWVTVVKKLQHRTRTWQQWPTPTSEDATIALPALPPCQERLDWHTHRWDIAIKHLLRPPVPGLALTKIAASWVPPTPSMPFKEKCVCIAYLWRRPLLLMLRAMWWPLHHPTTIPTTKDQTKLKTTPAMGIDKFSQGPMRSRSWSCSQSHSFSSGDLTRWKLAMKTLPVDRPVARVLQL